MTTQSLTFSETLQRQVRTGDYWDQAKSTWAKISERIEARDGEDAAALAAYALDEMAIHCDVMAQWRADLRRLLADRGIPPDGIAEHERSALSLLELPDGRRFDVDELWSEVRGLVAEIQEQCASEQWDAALRACQAARERWRQLSDRDVDWCCALMDFCVRELGEGAIPEMWEAIIGPLFDWRYAKFNVAKSDWATSILPTLMYVALEAMRSYLSTPKRDGSRLELHEHSDRWVLRFDPCGSGGRTLRADPIEGTPPRTEPPFSFRVIEGAYDWTDGKRGVCVYCNHCQVLMEHMPIDRLGYPLRVVNPPLYRKGAPDEKCEWTMYKDPLLVPDEVYSRCGRTRPARLGSLEEKPLAPSDHQPFVGQG